MIDFESWRRGEPAHPAPSTGFEHWRRGDPGLSFFSPPTGQLSITPGAGSLALTGFSPSIAISLLVIPSGSISLTGFAPTVTAPWTSEPGVGALTLSGFSPAIFIGRIVVPPAGSLALTGFAPEASVIVGAHPISLSVSATIGEPTGLFAGLLALYIAGIDRRMGYLAPNTLRVGREISSRAQASCTLRDRTGQLMIVPGQTVYVYQGNTRIFGGTVEEVTEQHAAGTASFVSYQITAQDFARTFDRRVVTELSFGVGATIAQIVGQITQRFLDGEGLAIESATASITLPAPITFGPETVAQAFRKVCDIFQVDFKVDAYGMIRFGPFTADPAPFTLRDADGHWFADTMKITKRRGPYRNRELIATGAGVESVREESFVGDDERQAFNTTFSMSLAPAITLNGAEQLVTELGDEGPSWDWAWERGGTILQQNYAATPISASDTLIVRYRSDATNLVITQDDTEIGVRAAAEGGSGKYERIRSAPYITDPAMARAISEGRLARFGRGLASVLEFETLEEGLDVGQVIDVDLTHPLIDGDFLVNGMESSDVSATYIRHAVRCAANEDGTPARAPDSLTNYFERIFDYAGITSSNGGSTTPQILDARFFLAVTLDGEENPGISVGLQKGNGHTVRLRQFANTLRASLFDCSIFFLHPPVGTGITIDIKANIARAQEMTADAGTDTITADNHRLQIGEIVRFSSDGTLPDGIEADTNYYVVARTTNTFQVSLTDGGSPIDIEDAGSGTITFSTARSSIFRSGSLTFPAGMTMPVITSAFDPDVEITDGTVLTIDVLAVGSDEPGSDGHVFLRYY